MSTVYVDAIGIVTPGIANWEKACEIFSEQAPYTPEAMPRYKPTLLPPNERRRATNLVRLAFEVCEQIEGLAHIDAEHLATVFASCGGDYQIIDQISRALTQEEKMVSPTQFHNSVHNSAAGYWSIATGAKTPSTSLSAYDASFANGLLEAIALVNSEHIPALFACYDTQPPEPILSKRPISQAFATAMALYEQASEHSIASLHIEIAGQNTAASKCALTDLETLRTSNPAARCLPLLELLSAKKSGVVHLEDNAQNSFQITVTPC